MASDRNSESVQEVKQSGVTSAENSLPKEERKRENDEEDGAEKTTENNRRLWVGNLSPKLTE